MPQTPNAPAAAPPPQELPMVRWFDPALLLSTGIQVLLSAALGQRFDYRTMEDVALDQGVFDYSGAPTDGPGFTFDYLADTGDGWESTYAVASLVARRELEIGDEALPRGRFLILGGDEVYPTASQRSYRERLVAPFEAALPLTDPPHPHVFAIPGNHDWYDGLVSFSRRFTQHRWFGGWRTRQRRSYFALRLPKPWWLWAVDVQLESDIDIGQRNYFQDIADRHLGPRDRVILATAEPDWLYRDIRDPKAESNLAYLEERIIKPTGARVFVWVAGDLHHYRRHEHARDPGLQRIVSGGGGAYLSSTHQPLLAPDTTPVSRTIMVGAERFEQRCAFPGPATSMRLSLLDGLFLPKNWKFGLLTGVAYTLLTWGLAPAAPPWRAMPSAGDVVDHPARLALALLVVLGTMFYADRYSPLFRWLGGFLHGCAHLALAFLIAYWSADAARWAAWLTDSWGWIAIWRLGYNFAEGAVLGSILFGFYLFVAMNIFGAHADHAFAALRIRDYKHFLRFRIQADGALQIYPIALPRVPRSGQGHAQYMLIEGPVSIRP